MELIEIKGVFNMDTGAPCPTIISNDTNLILSFYADKDLSFYENEGLTLPHQRNIVHDIGVITITFSMCQIYKFGVPNDETLHAHLYHKLGLGYYSFYILKDSDWVKSIDEMSKQHPLYNPNRSHFMPLNHYIITFHDNTFECIASHFEVRESNSSLYDRTKALIAEISEKHS